MRLLQVTYESVANCTADDPTVFACFRFDGQPTDSDRDFDTGLLQASGAPVREVWRYAGPSESATMDGVRMVLSPDYLLAGATVDGTCLRTAGRDVYRGLVRLIREQGFDYILRAWNSVPDINGGEGDDERYKQFCLGRAEALDEICAANRPPPAATAVGSAPDQPLRVSLLASRAAPGLVENPRQVSAYRYPRQYGPRSPTFSRAAVLSNAKTRQMFLSGTAAIVGHETRFEGDGSGQVHETLENIRHLVHSAGFSGSEATLRVYLRDPALNAEAMRQVSRFVPESERVVILAAELCRRELLIEMDGVLATG